MNKEEFLELKENLTNVVIEYELLQRKATFLNNSYLLEFHDELSAQRYLHYENQYLTSAIVMKNDGKSDAEIKEFLDNCQKEFKNIINNFEFQYRTAKELEKKCSKYTLADMQALDFEMIDYIKLYHPVIKFHSTNNEKNIYNMLINMYRFGNISGFRTLLNNNKDNLKAATISEEDYDSAAHYYNLSLKNISSLLYKLKNEFPLNNEELFKDEKKLNDENFILRQKNNELRTINKKIHKDFVINFNFDFEL